MSQYAAELAAKESNPTRKAELLRISEVNARVPAHAPSTFWEAIQAVWTVESLLVVEENQTGMSIGRVDQYMYPFFKADLEAGRLTEYQAFDLAGCMLIKMSEMMWLTSEGSSKFFAGYQPFVNMCVGGVSREGRDATNDLTYLLMDAVRHVRIYQPSLATRVHNTSPQEYLKKIVSVIRSGMGFPAVHFDDTHIKMMLAKGVSIEDARDYCLMGCVEPQKAGRLYQWTSTAYTQWPICIELVLNHGVPLWFGKQVCPDLGDLSQFDTYEKFDAAVKEQIKYITKWTSVATVISQRIHRDLAPKPLMSIMVKAAYSSGTPALGVGAGNVPAFIERSANVEEAVAKIMSSKTFDNGTICASEQSIVTESCIADKVRATLEAQGGYFLTGEKLEKVKRLMWPRARAIRLPPCWTSLPPPTACCA
jgi:Pyruvate-formate lyase